MSAVSRAATAALEALWWPRGGANGGAASAPSFGAPLGFAFATLAQRRRRRLEARRAPTPLPVFVIGNLTVGGTGKTPLVAAVAARARTLGLRCGIVSRGYGAQPQRAPVAVRGDSDPNEVGDEPVLLARATGCPVAVCTDRAAAVGLLAARGVRHGQLDLVLSDDGLQHYAMAREIELCVIDAERGLGNGRLLPTGPLREGAARLDEVDAIALRGAHGALPDPDALPPGVVGWPAGVPRGGFALRPTSLSSLGGSGEPRPLHSLVGLRVHAVAGIARPSRFFDTLAALGADVVPHAFPDHHRYRADDLAFDDASPLVTTAKDAVKLERLPRGALVRDAWTLDVAATLSGELERAVDRAIVRCVRPPETA